MPILPLEAVVPVLQAQAVSTTQAPDPLAVRQEHQRRSKRELSPLMRAHACKTPRSGRFVGMRLDLHLYL
jgi:hypothetical protein